MSDPVTFPDLGAARSWLDRLGSRVRKRGRYLHLSGQVRRLWRDPYDHVYKAEVGFSRPYLATLSYRSRRWDAECTCTVAQHCEHAAAAFEALLAGDEEGAPTATPRTGGAPSAAPPLDQKVSVALGRRLRPPEQRFLELVRDLYRRALQFRQLTGWDLQSLGLRSHTLGWDRLELWPKVPADEFEFWLYLVNVFTQHRIDIPEFMRGVSDLAPIQAELEQWNRQRAIVQWRKRLEQAAASREASVSRRIDLRLCFGADQAYLERRWGVDTPYQRVDDAQYRQMVTELGDHLHLVAAEAMAIWQAMLPRLGDYGSAVLPYSDSRTVRVLNPLVRFPPARERFVNPDGQPLVWPDDSLHWALTPAASEQEDYRLRLVRADGSDAPPVRLALPGEPTLYVCSDCVLPGPPTSSALDPVRENAVPAPALESREGVALLDRLGLEPPERLAARIQRVKVPLEFRCHLGLSNPYSRAEMLLLHAVSQVPGESTAEEWTASGWHVPQSQTPRRLSEGEPILLHDRSLQSNVRALLAPLGLTWSEEQRCWRLRVGRAFPATFIEWARSLPREVDLVLDEDLQTLLREPVKARLRIDSTEVEVDWFDLSVELKVEDDQLTPEEVQVLLKARGSLVRLPGKGWRRLDFDLTDEQDQQLARLGLSVHDFSDEPQRFHALQLADGAAERLLGAEQAERIRRRADEIRTRVTPPLPDGVRAALRPYQVEGFHFLAYLTANRFGGILADDMGLGKTLQTLCWLTWLRADQPGSEFRALVVCPKSVKDNWRIEAERFVPDLRVKLWQGVSDEGLAEAVEAHDIVVINYAQLRGLAAALATIEWRAVILDEGQIIKNAQSQAARAACALRAGHRLVLSGTPIENRLLDLWSLMRFAMPGMLGNQLAFSRRFGKEGDPLARRRLSARVRPFLLRRTKQQVAQDLPDRVEEDIFCELEGRQLTLYRAEYKRARQLLLGIQTEAQLNELRFHFLTSLLRLRQICCHPALYDAEAHGAPSAKVEALTDLLDPLLAEGHKVLVFSQFVQMLELLHGVAVDREWPRFQLTGQTENRGELIESFQRHEGAAVFLVSLKAGGFGLNLTAASYVVLFDPWWNPAVEAQAIDRTHRIGQTQKVIAYRLLIKHSIEEKIRLLQRHKRALAEDVLGDENFAKALTLDDLRYLFADESE